LIRFTANLRRRTLYQMLSCCLWYIPRYKACHIAPTELEAAAQTHPAVKESLAFGFPDPHVQEMVTLVVVLNEGFTVKKS
jgi:hypothetical protein